MIHETRKRAKIPDTSVYGIATDSFKWAFIRIRPNGEVRDLGETCLDNSDALFSGLKRPTTGRTVRKKLSRCWQRFLLMLRDSIHRPAAKYGTKGLNASS